MRRLIDGWRQRRATLGVPLLGLYALSRALERVSDGRARIVPYAFVAQPIGNPKLAAVRDDAQTAVFAVAPGAAVTAEFPRPPEVIRWRFETGAVCHVATVKDRFAGFIWTRRDGYDEDDVRCRYRLGSSHAVWDFDVYVAPAYRLGRTMARMWKAVDLELQREGVRWSLSRISLFNPASLAAHARLGAQRVGTACFVVCGRFQLAWLPAPRRLHFSASAASAPQITLTPPEGNLDDSSSNVC